MKITMVKKRLADGSDCRKCVQTEEMLRDRGVRDAIDEVVWAQEGDSESPGMKLGAAHGVDTAPFFLVERVPGQVEVYVSALKLLRDLFPGAPLRAERNPGGVRGGTPRNNELEGRGPQEILRWGLERHGVRCAIAFSGAEDVVLIDMAVATGLPFSVFTLDTGRLPPETYEFIETVRNRYRIEIRAMSPDAARVEALVRDKGLFSFYDDGHTECCSIRKVEPLRRALADYDAWVTGQRRDQSLETRAELRVVEPDGPRTKLNPLAAWTSAQVWDYIRDRDVPFNPLHQRGYRSIGCAPCTRPIAPGQHEREGRWWWESADKKECGLHVAATRK